MELSISAQMESILFWKGEPMTVKEVSKILGIEENVVRENISVLQNELENRGVVLITTEDKLSLVTNSLMSEKISALVKEELSKDLSKATLETLSIILYRGAVTRSEIDYVRGVNSQFILRALSVRGLVDRETDPKDERAYLYKPSIDLLAHLGVTKRDELPDFDKINSEILTFMNQNDKIGDNSNKTQEETEN
jgi:segregation and condensation protein B